MHPATSITGKGQPAMNALQSAHQIQVMQCAGPDPSLLGYHCRGKCRPIDAYPIRYTRRERVAMCGRRRIKVQGKKRHRQFGSPAQSSDHACKRKGVKACFTVHIYCCLCHYPQSIRLQSSSTTGIPTFNPPQTLFSNIKPNDDITLRPGSDSCGPSNQ